MLTRADNFLEEYIDLRRILEELSKSDARADRNSFSWWAREWYSEATIGQTAIYYLKRLEKIKTRAGRTCLSRNWLWTQADVGVSMRDIRRFAENEYQKRNDIDWEPVT